MKTSRAEVLDIRQWRLSPAQERLVFVHEMSEADNGYLFPVNVRLRGLLNVPALEEALRLVVERHEVLHSRVVTAGGGLRQETTSDPFALSVENLLDFEPAERLRVAEQRVDEEADTPFDLARAWFRGRLLRTGEAENILLLSFHHIAFDGWSYGVFTRDLAEFYEAEVDGRTADLEPLALQFGDIAEWERRRIEKGDDLADEIYWAERLSPLPGDLDLPTDRPRPATPSGKASRTWLHLGEELTRGIDTLARAKRCTVHMILMAAYQETLRLASGCTDFAVGGALSGRVHPESAALIGLFVNDVVYRSECRAGQSFSELLARIKKTSLAVYRHGGLALQRLVDISRPPRRPDRHPLFQHTLALQPREADDEGFRLKGVVCEAFSTRAEGSALDLAVSMHYETDGLHAAFDYSQDLWSDGSMVRLAANYRAVLTAMVANPDSRAEDVDIESDWVVLPHHGSEAPATEHSYAHADLPGFAHHLESIRGVWSDLLGHKAEVDTNFFDAGGDSILALHTVNRCRAEGISVRVRDFFAHQNMKDFALATFGPGSAQTAIATRRGPAKRLTGVVPLLPIQSWFFAQGPVTAHYNFTSLYRHQGRMDIAALRRAVAVTLKRHDVSRIRFRILDGTAVEQYYLDGPGHEPLIVHDLSDRHDYAAARVELEALAQDIQESLHIVDSILIRCALFLCPDGTDALLIAASHLVMDVASMQVVVEDITRAYEQSSHRKPIELLPLTVSTQEWSGALAEYAKTPGIREQIPFWASADGEHDSSILVDHPGASNIVEDQVTRAFRLLPQDVRPLRQWISVRPGTSMSSVLLAAAAHALSPLVLGAGLVIDMEGHGREELNSCPDASRTVGWLTSIFPIAIPVRSGKPATALVEEVFARQARIPDNGLGYGILARQGERIHWREKSVAFSYMGSMTSGAGNGTGLFEFDALPPRGSRDASLKRRHDLEIDAFIVDDTMRISLTFGARRYDEETIERIGEAQLAFLREVVSE